MALINCEKCGNEVSDKAKFCPHCLSQETQYLCSLFSKYENIMLFDLETTGLDPKKDLIIEFAALNVTYNNEIPFVRKEVDVFVKLPKDVQIDDGIAKLTGITNKLIEDEGITQKELFRLVELCIKSYGKTLLVSHNAQFDMRFLKKLFDRFGHIDIFEQIDVLDSLTICRDRFSYPHKLVNAIERYGLSQYVQNTHRGIDDVYALFEVCKALAREHDDLDRYINVFGYNVKFGIDEELDKITYIPQNTKEKEKLYEILEKSKQKHNNE